MTSLTQEKFSEKYHIPLPTLRHWERGDRECPSYVLELLESKVREDIRLENKVVGYFMKTGIFYQGKELPPQKTPIILIGDRPAFNIDYYLDDDDIPVLSAEGNWYTIKKKDILHE